jgi:hypothetical protein
MAWLYIPIIIALCVYVAYLHQVIAETASERDHWRESAFKTQRDYMESTQQVIKSDEYVERLRRNNEVLKEYERVGRHADVPTAEAQ